MYFFISFVLIHSLIAFQNLHPSWTQWFPDVDSNTATVDILNGLNELFFLYHQTYLLLHACYKHANKVINYVTNRVAVDVLKKLDQINGSQLKLNRCSMHELVQKKAGLLKMLVEDDPKVGTKFY